MEFADRRQPTPEPAWQHAALFVALELSGKTWLVATSAPGDPRISKRTLDAGDGAGLVELLEELRRRVEQRRASPVPIVAVQEAGLDGFWLHRLLVAHGIASQVVVAASIAVDRRKRRRKTDAIDVETLLRTLMAWCRGERGVCSMVRPPDWEDEDLRRLCREREELLCERIRHTNRIKGLLNGQGIRGFHPLDPGDRGRIDELVTGDGRPLPPRLKAELRRQLGRLDLVVRDLVAVEAERDALIEAARADDGRHGLALLVRLKSIGNEFASVLWLEALFRPFANRRQVAAYAGLAPTPWQSGGMERDQGISKAGNARLRRTMIQLAWLWIRHQPGSVISRWFVTRVGTMRGRVRRIAIVAVARKLLVALWRYVDQGLVPEGATLKG